MATADPRTTTSEAGVTRRGQGILPSELRPVVRELQSWVGSPVGEVRVPRPGVVVLQAGRFPPLWIEVEPTASLHTVGHAPRNPRAPFSFQGLLRARAGGPLTAVRQLHDDRVVELDFPGGTLHCRLFPGGGIWWLESGQAVAASHGPCPAELPALTATPGTELPPRFQPEAGQTWLEAAARWYAAEARRSSGERLLAHLRSELRRRLARERRLHTNLLRDLAAADRAPALRADADGLAAVLHLVPRGASAMEVPDFETGGIRAVRLDPAQPAANTLTKLYDRAGRLERAGHHILDRCLRCEAQILALESGLADALVCTGAGAAELARRLAVGAPPTGARVEQVRAKPWATWRSPDGAEVWIGRSAQGNRALVFRHARGRDLWIHLRERPSAHAVVPAVFARSSAVVDAAVQLLLRATRAEPGDLLEVQLARVADVRPKPGGEPGEVVVNHERVRAVRFEPELVAAWTATDPARPG